MAPALSSRMPAVAAVAIALLACFASVQAALPPWAFKHYVYVTQVRRDLRRCAYPLCGGWYYTELNDATVQQKYVTNIVFNESVLDAATIATVNQYLAESSIPMDPAQNSKSTFLVLAGKQQPYSGPMPGGWLDLIVDKVFMGLPGVPVVTPGNTTYWQANTSQLLKLNTNTTITSRYYNRSAIDLKIATDAEPLSPQDFYLKRLKSGSAIVAGSIIKPNFALVVQQLFLALPDPVPQSACKSKTVSCKKANQLEVYARDADRCVKSLLCLNGPIFCPLYLPGCNDGYSLNSWIADYGCSAFSCDPAFLQTSVLPP